MPVPMVMDPNLFQTIQSSATLLVIHIWKGEMGRGPISTDGGPRRLGPHRVQKTETLL